MASTSGAATIYRQCTPSRLGSCDAPAAVAAGVGSQRRSQQQQGKALAAADKGIGIET